MTNAAFAQALGRALHRPSFLRAPRFALRLLSGEVTDAMTTGQRGIAPEGHEAGVFVPVP